LKIFLSKKQSTAGSAITIIEVFISSESSKLKVENIIELDLGVHFVVDGVVGKQANAFRAEKVDDLLGKLAKSVIDVGGVMQRQCPV
jgi:hypothetical protein